MVSSMWVFVCSRSSAVCVTIQLGSSCTHQLVWGVIKRLSHICLDSLPPLGLATLSGRGSDSPQVGRRAFSKPLSAKQPHLDLPWYLVYQSGMPASFLVRGRLVENNGKPSVILPIAHAASGSVLWPSFGHLRACRRVGEDKARQFTTCLRSRKHRRRRIQPRSQRQLLRAHREIPSSYSYTSAQLEGALLLPPIVTPGHWPGKW